MRNYKPNMELLEDFDEYVSGHLEAKKALINLVHRSKQRHYQKFVLGVYPEYLLTPSKILLIGKSGTGKTHLVESLNKLVTFPLIRINATELNPTGASGGIKLKDLEAMIIDEAKLWAASNDYMGAEYNSVEGTVDQTVVFIDEIDKLGRSFDSSGSWNKHVQSNFLTLFDAKTEFAGVSFIFAGAFTDITDNKSESKSFGFTNNIDSGKAKDLDAEVIKSGLIPELVGRLNNICELDKFTIDHYYNILKSKLLPKKHMDLAALGVFDTYLSEEKARDIAERAYKSGQGVRFLIRELEKEYLELEFNCEDDQIFLGYDQL